MNLPKLLNSPYPFYENARQGFKISLSIGVFITAFCYFFRPFGIAKLDTYGILGYGLVSFLVCSFYIFLLPLIFTKTLRNKHWKIYKEILWISMITTSIATANYFYSGFIFNAGYALNLKIFLFVLTCTAIVAIIPAITIILYKQLFVYKKIVKEVEQMDSKLLSKSTVFKTHGAPSQNLVSLFSENKKDHIDLASNDFLFLSSSGNYVELFFMDEEVIQKKLLRNNISKIEQQLTTFSHIIRCHRSHIININRVKHIDGNLQGYQLQFDQVSQQIPVSRSFTKKIKSLLLKLT